MGDHLLGALVFVSGPSGKHLLTSYPAWLPPAESLILEQDIAAARVNAKHFKRMRDAVVEAFSAEAALEAETSAPATAAAAATTAAAATPGAAATAAATAGEAAAKKASSAGGARGA